MNYRLKKDLPWVKVGAEYSPMSKLYSCTDKDFLVGDIGISTISKEYVENNPEWFEPINEYKVGDWVIVSKDAETMDGRNLAGKAICIGEIDSSMGLAKRFIMGYEGCKHGIWLKEIERLATKEEIDAVTKKFPFEFTAGESQEKCEATDQGEFVYIQNFSNDMVKGAPIDEPTWRKIGQYKGWSL